jgi:hypothetical protein|tara:strand:+ start:1780 stop:2505 length:726 start_codon:yes stop_codon:yes gene_type:complete
MAYNYLNLVNDVSRRVNETELTSGNFATATGYYNTAKDAINSSIRLLNQESFQWPFNYVEQEDTLTAGDLRYDNPSNAKTLDFNTFRIKRDATFGNSTTLLKTMDYEEFLSRYADDEYNTSDTGIRSLPRTIVRAPGNQYIVHPSPDNAYELVYEYYSLPVDLILFSDVPSTPEAFRHVLTDGAMYYVQIFRNDNESAQMSLQKFQEGIKNMRAIYTNRYEYVRDTRINQSGSGIHNGRVG